VDFAVHLHASLASLLPEVLLRPTRLNRMA